MAAEAWLGREGILKLAEDLGLGDIRAMTRPGEL